ncbi:MAG: hypothetical protein OXD33_13085 [Rhodobacteraceae bacterium]|nr:hypothetical protein [Paracoccaceae bacterium]
MLLFFGADPQRRRDVIGVLDTSPNIGVNITSVLRAAGIDTMMIIHVLAVGRHQPCR